MRDLHRGEQVMVTARWVATGFALLQVLVYASMPYPRGVRPLALGLVALLALGNAVFALLDRRIGHDRPSTRLAAASFAFDIVVAMGFVATYTFDPTSALWAVLFIIPVDGAIRFRLPGALVGWGAITALYTAREVWGSATYAYPFDWTSITFRMGLILIVGVAVGLLARDVARERAQLEDALGELERVDRLRARLVATLAHDIRNPIGVVLGALSMLRDRKQLDAATHDEVIELALRQAVRMRLLASGLLDLARAENGALLLRREPVRLRDLLERTVGYLDDRAAIRIEIAEGLAVDGDEQRLEQVFVNLLTNAQRHGAAPIVVSGRARDEGVEVSVTDAGQGFDPERAASLFQPFAPGTSSDSVGLGLWIAHELTVAHGGTLTIDAQRPDSGATFRVWLPAGQLSTSTHPASLEPAEAVIT